MARINLLPWREQRRQELRKEFFIMIALALVLGVVLLFLGDRIVNAQIEHQKARNQYLTQHIRELDKMLAEIRDLKRRRNQLIDRMRVIQELQGNRPVIVRVMDQLVRTIPDGVFYTSVALKGRRISIQGVAESNNRVSSLMRQLDASEWLAKPNLDAVRAMPRYGDQATRFNMSVRIQTPNSDKDESQPVKKQKKGKKKKGRKG